MIRRAPATAAAVVALAAGGTAIADATGGGPATPAAKPLRYADARMIIEVNATDGDAGLQVFADGEAWRLLTIARPDGRRIFDIAARGRLRRLGLTELFAESNEPTFDRLPLARFKERFPAGRYRFAGTTVDGRRLVGSARLSHATPDGPRLLAPAAGATVPRERAAVSWAPVAEPPGIDVTGYRVIVEREDPLRAYSVDLPATATSVPIPAEFLEPRTPYKFEVQAIEASGNQTLTEREFRTR